VIRAWHAAGDVARQVAVEEAVRLGMDGPGAVWIDFEDEPAAAVTAALAPLGIHPLVIEDLVAEVNRPKVDSYGHYLYLVVHSARWDDDQPLLRELDVVVGRHFLITHHDGPTRSVDTAHEVLPRRPDLLARGPAVLMHFLLDVLVDLWLPIMEQVNDEIDVLEESLFAPEMPDLHRGILRLKRGMSRLRRIVGPQRDTILALTRDEFEPIPPEIRPYLRDVYDRLARVNDLLDSFRDETGALLELHVSQVSNQLNQVIKRLTVVATIGLPLTIVTSYYGMNVGPDRIFPAFRWLPAHVHPIVWVWLVIVATTAATWWLLRHRRWL
jgi:magnesium transporter